MTDIETIGTPHECFAALLFDMDARELISIACKAIDLEAPESTTVLTKDPRVELPSINKRAKKHIVDLLFTVIGADGKVSSVWVLEIQLSEDWTKLALWSLYALAFGIEFGGKGRVVLFVPEPELRAKIRRRLGEHVPEPILVELDQIERITDYDEARRRPQLTILGALYHVHEPVPLEQRIAAFRAAWVAAQTFDDQRALRYTVLIMSLTPRTVRDAGIAQLRKSGNFDEKRYEEVSDTERLGSTFSIGHEEGLEQGLEHARRVLRRAIVDLLELRGLVADEQQRERLDACEQLETLERWYAAAKHPSNQSVEQVLTR